MSTNRLISRAAALTAAISITGLFAAGTASAHVTANIYGKPAEQGGYTAIVFRVPNEEADAGTVKVEISIAPEYALGSARTKPIPGWQAEVTKTKLDQPVTSAGGAQLDEVVTKVTWTAERGHKIAAGSGEYEEFALSAGPLPTDVDTLVLPAAQHYEGGKVINWDAPPAADGAEEPERPAPVVELAESSGDGHGGVTATSGSEEDAAAAVDTTARWLGGIGLAIGALGLGFGAGATLRARKALAGAKDTP
ncbi:MAG: YcnI family protein [Haloechinothrix sp.]